MLKNYIIGFLSAYIFVTLPFWEWDGDLVAQGFLMIITALSVAWLIALHEIDIKKAHRRRIRQGYTVRKTVVTEYIRKEKGAA